MRNPVIIPESRERYIVNQKVNIKEDIKMSLLNMCMNIGYLDININIKRDERKKRKIIKKSIDNQQRINEVLEERNNFDIKHNLTDYMR